MNDPDPFERAAAMTNSVMKRIGRIGVPIFLLLFGVVHGTIAIVTGHAFAAFGDGMSFAISGITLFLFHEKRRLDRRTAELNEQKHKQLGQPVAAVFVRNADADTFEMAAIYEGTTLAASSGWLTRSAAFEAGARAIVERK